MKIKIRKGDTVYIRAGKDRGKTGKVLAVMPKENRLVVEGLNLVKKHIRPRRAGEKGQVVEVPAAMPVARVMLNCPACNKPTRVGLKKETSERFCKKCNAIIPRS